MFMDQSQRVQLDQYLKYFLRLLNLISTGTTKDLTISLVVLSKQAIFPFKLLNAADGTRNITSRNRKQKNLFFYLESSINNS